MKTLRDYDGKVDKRYAIAENGSYVRDKKTKKKKIPYIHDGYRFLSLTINGKYYNIIKISHLQYLAWYGGFPKGHHIHHKDEDKLNDHKDNYKCLSNSEHRKFHNAKEGHPMLGRTGENHPMYGLTGDKHPASKFLEFQIEKIKYFRYIKSWTQQRIANELGISRNHIGAILRGNYWNPNHLTKEEIKKNFCSGLVKIRPSLNFKEGR